MKKISIFVCFIALVLSLGCEKQKPQWLYVLHAPQGELTSDTLTLKNTNTHVLAFTDQPIRKCKMIPVTNLIAGWSQIFAKDPPNTALTFFKYGQKYEEITVELKKPKVVGDDIVFQIHTINYEVKDTEELEETILFIDGSSVINII